MGTVKVGVRSVLIFDRFDLAPLRPVLWRSESGGGKGYFLLPLDHYYYAPPSHPRASLHYETRMYAKITRILPS
jgi:hypothetical protein